MDSVVWHVGEEEGGNLRENEQLKVQSVYGRIILKLILKKSDGTAWTVLL